MNAAALTLVSGQEYAYAASIEEETSEHMSIQYLIENIFCDKMEYLP